MPFRGQRCYQVSASSRSYWYTRFCARQAVQSIFGLLFSPYSPLLRQRMYLHICNFLSFSLSLSWDPFCFNTPLHSRQHYLVFSSSFVATTHGTLYIKKLDTASGGSFSHGVFWVGWNIRHFLYIITSGCLRPVFSAMSVLYLQIRAIFSFSLSFFLHMWSYFWLFVIMMMIRVSLLDLHLWSLGFNCTRGFYLFNILNRSPYSVPSRLKFYCLWPW